MDDLDSCPAYAIDALGDLAYWNSAADRVFMLSMPVRPPHEGNLLWRHFVEPRARELYESWPDVARTTLSYFRKDFAKYPGDPRFEELVGDLTEESAEFREWWPRHDVANEHDGRKRIIHPEAGLLTLGYSALQVPADPNLRVNVYAPSTQEDFERLAKLAKTPHGWEQ